MTDPKGKKSKHLAETPLKTYKKPLPVRLKSDEILSTSTAAGKLNAAIEKEEAELKTASADAKTSIKEKKARLRKLLDGMKTGTREEEVEVMDIPVWAENKVEIVRKDTGEVVDIRAMVAAERQKDLTVKDKADDKKPAKN